MQLDCLGLRDGDLFSRDDATAAGLTGRSIAKLVASGAVARLGPGIYRAGPNLDSDPGAIARGLQAVLSYESSAAWLGASLPSAVRLIHVTASRSRGRPADCAPGVRLHRANLDPAERLILRGVEVTIASRTILDIARGSPLTDAVAIGDSLCRLGRTTVDEVRSAALALPRAPGRQAAVMVAELLDVAAESVFESISRTLIVTAGLPAPISQFQVFDQAGRWIARVDFAWREQRLILECDGFEFHGSREQYERDRRRWSALTRAGWRVVVVTWRDVLGDPAYLIGLIADLLR